MKNLYARSVLFVLGSYVCYAITVVIVARMPYEINPIKIYYFEILFAMLFSLPLMIKQGKALFLTSQLRLYFIRALVAMVSMFFFFSSLRLLPTIDAILVKHTSPFFLVILSVLLLKERISKMVWPLILIGFIGVYVIIGPFDSTFSFTHLYPLLTAVGFACASICIARLLERDTVYQAVFSLYIIALLLMTPIILLTWEMFPLGAWLCLIGAGFAYALAQYFYISALSFSMPGRLAPYHFSELFFVYVILHMVFGVSLTKREMIGGLLIVSSMLIMFWLTRRKQEPTFD